MMDRQKGQYVLECNGCAAPLETNVGDFGDALQVMRDNKWRSVPPTRNHSGWQHYCSDCKTPTGAVR